MAKNPELEALEMRVQELEGVVFGLLTALSALISAQPDVDGARAAVAAASEPMRIAGLNSVHTEFALEQAHAVLALLASPRPQSPP